MSPETVTAQDVVFDCPKCRKSLVVDQRAAGLKVPCPQCGQEAEVPQPAHGTQALEHQDDVTIEEKLSHLENQMAENRVQYTEAINKLNDHITQANRYKLRIQKLESDYQKMEEQLNNLTEKKK